MGQIVREGPGFRVESGELGDTLVVTDRFTAEAARLLESGSVSGLDLNYAKGFENSDLEFVDAWSVTRVSVLARTVTNIEPLYRLPSLVSLSLSTGPKCRLDLRRMPKLTTLSTDWALVGDSISERPEIEDLYLGGFAEADLTRLRWNVALRRLRLKDRPRLESLDGVESFALLEQLGVWSAPLADLNGLRGLRSGRLLELQLESCRLHDLEPVCSLESLRFLNLSDNGELSSVRCLTALKALEVLWLFGTTRVVDGDLSVLAHLPLKELRMKSRKQYRPSVEQLQLQITNR